MDQQTFNFSGGEVLKLNENVLVIKYVKDRKIRVEDLENLTRIRRSVLGEIPYYPIIDLSNGITSFDEDAKVWVAENKESSEVRIVDIILVKGHTMKLKIQFYYSLFKPLVKKKVVKSIDEALDFIVIQEDKRKRKLKRLKRS